MLILSPDGTQMFVDASFYAPTQKRFLHDHLDCLVAHGFLSSGYSDAGSPTYRITRRGAKFIELTQQNQTDKG
jgi:predicted transcriptional regulator